MAQYGIRYDFRCPPICPVGPADLYEAALEQCAWADALGFGRVTLSEHHGSADGYLPSIVGAGFGHCGPHQPHADPPGGGDRPAARPLRLAEDLSVVDHLSRGRLEVVLANGYVPSEFEMFEVQLSDG